MKKIIYFYNKKNLAYGIRSFKVKDILYLKGKGVCIPYYLVTEFNLNTYKYEDFDLWVSITDINQEGIYEYESSLFSKIVMSFDKKKLVNKYNDDLEILIKQREDELRILHKINIEGVI